MKRDQMTDNDQGMSPNMTLNTTSKSPQHGTTIRAVTWRDDSDGSDSDNNGYHDRITVANLKRVPG